MVVGAATTLSCVVSPFLCASNLLSHNKASKKYLGSCLTWSSSPSHSTSSDFELLPIGVVAHAIF
jgi:hypothetical protein